MDFYWLAVASAALLIVAGVLDLELERLGRELERFGREGE